MRTLQIENVISPKVAMGFRFPRQPKRLTVGGPNERRFQPFGLSAHEVHNKFDVSGLTLALHPKLGTSFVRPQAFESITENQRECFRSIPRKQTKMLEIEDELALEWRLNSAIINPLIVQT
jgi:hypothetical protein